MDNDFIRRDDVINVIDCTNTFTFTRERTTEKIRAIPAADVAPVVHGKWEFEYENLDEQIEYCCSVCDWIGLNANGYNYCPNCGAKMEVQDA